MSYSSYSYLLLFLPIAFLVYYIVPKKARWIVLLAADYAFYYISSSRLPVFLLISTVSIYLGGLWLDRIQSGFDAVRKTLEKDERKKRKAVVQRQKKGVVTLLLFINFGLLVFLKYGNFLGESAFSLARLFGANGTFKPMKLMQPLGISFYTLQAVSYVIDVYRCKYKATHNFAKIALFLSFFPQVVEGPIGRYDVIGEQLYEGHKFDYDRVCWALQLLLWGLFKKVVIADRAALLVNKVFNHPEDHFGAAPLLAMLFYTLQLYAEFSGCMDIVRGTAGAFGVELQENFRRPFFSTSVNEFWRRWHITLGAWLRDYIFYSISLSKAFMKVSKWAKKHFNAFVGNLLPAAFALFFVWFGNGVWHGAGWKYIVYGLYYYLIMLLGMIFEPLFVRFFEKSGITRDSKGMNRLKMFRTFVFVNIGMMIFRADTLTTFGKMFASIFSADFFGSVRNVSLGMDIFDAGVLLVGCCLMFVISSLQEKGHSIRAEVAQKSLPVRWVLYLGLILSIVIFGAYGQNYGQIDFIYGQF